MSAVRDPLTYADDILESIRAIERNTSDSNLEEFLRSEKDQALVILKLIVIGEAAARLPVELRDLCPEIPWGRIIGMRNLIVHEYFRLDLELVWRVAEKDLAPLKACVEKILTW